MANVKLYKQDGSVNGEVTLNDDVFGIEPNKAVVYDAIHLQQASQRQGTHAVKNRSAVRGGGKKPWRQKGTGRARAGSSRNPIWRGGGTVFGPTPRSYGYKLPRKVGRLALKSALSDKVANESLIVLDSLSFDQPKTKNFVAVLNNLDVNTKVLVILANSEASENVALSARNLPNVKVIPANGVNVLDLVAADKAIITQDALTTVEEALS